MSKLRFVLFLRVETTYDLHNVCVYSAILTFVCVSCIYLFIFLIFCRKSGQFSTTNIRMLNNPTNPTIIPATASMARVITTTTNNTSSATMGVGGRTVETHNYHLHHLSNDNKSNLEVDIKFWHQTLMQLLEEERNTVSYYHTSFLFTTLFKSV